MSAVLSREEVRLRIDLLEALDGVMSAITDIESLEFEDGERRSLNLQINCRDDKESPVAFAYAIPPEVVLAGLKAMQAKLEAQLA